jgi:hypothetical protein
MTSSLNPAAAAFFDMSSTSSFSSSCGSTATRQYIHTEASTQTLAEPPPGGFRGS